MRQKVLELSEFIVVHCNHRTGQQQQKNRCGAAEQLGTGIRVLYVTDGRGSIPEGGEVKN